MKTYYMTIDASVRNSSIAAAAPIVATLPAQVIRTDGCRCGCGDDRMRVGASVVVAFQADSRKHAQQICSTANGKRIRSTVRSVRALIKRYGGQWNHDLNWA